MFAKPKTTTTSFIKLSTGIEFCCTPANSLRTFTTEITKAGANLATATIDGAVVNPADVATTDATVVRHFFEKSFALASYDDIALGSMPSVTVVEKTGDATKWVVTIRVATGVITKATTVTPSDYNFTEI